MKLIGPIPEVHNLFDLCRVCQHNRDCTFLTQLTILMASHNRNAEVLITECGLFHEKNGYARDLHVVHPESLIPDEGDGSLPSEDPAPSVPAE